MDDKRKKKSVISEVSNGVWHSLGQFIYSSKKRGCNCSLTDFGVNSEKEVLLKRMGNAGTNTIRLRITMH